jgi:hypothetical protein
VIARARRKRFWLPPQRRGGGCPAYLGALLLGYSTMLSFALSATQRPYDYRGDGTLELTEAGKRKLLEDLASAETRH